MTFICREEAGNLDGWSDGGSEKGQERNQGGLCESHLVRLLLSVSYHALRCFGGFPGQFEWTGIVLKLDNTRAGRSSTTHFSS